MTAEHEFRQQPKPSEIALPDKLAKIKKADDFPAIKYKWNTNEEVLSLLTSLSNHDAWVAREVADRPQNGSMFLFDRSKVKHYRKDGYTWKKRRSGNTIREDHTRLKVEGIECLSVLYTHSALVPTFHRRCYWLLQNPQIVLVHYLNLVEECSKPITVSVYMSPDSHDDISQQLKAIYSGVSPDVKPEVTVSEESPPASPSSSEEGDTSSTKGKQQQKRNKAIYKISISPNKSLQAVPQNDKLSLKVMKVTRNEQGRLTVTGHREGSPSLDEDNSSHEGNDSGRINERGQSMCQSVVTSASTRDNHVFATCAQNFFNQESLRDVSVLSAVPMVTNPPVSALSCPVQNTVSTTTVTTTTNSQFPQQNHASNAISINPLSRETSSNSGIQWNSVFVHPRVADLSSSPSSDYGSYLSDAGTRLSFSGSDSLSGGLSAQSFPDSDQAMFDGPFRLPLPVTRDCPLNFADSAKSDQGLSQGMCWLADCSPGAPQSSGNDVPVDTTDFSPLELLGFDDMFDCNLSNVIPECLNSPPKQSENVPATSVGENLHPTYSTASNTSTQSSSLTLNSFSADSLVSQPPGTFHVTTPGLSSTTSYVFVKPVSPVRNTVVTSCFVSVSNNTPSSSSRVSVCRASTQSLAGGQRESNEVTVPDICMTPVVSQPTSNQVAHGSSAKTNSNHQSLSSDINNNTSRPIDAGETTTFTSSLHPRNHVVPGSARITDFSPEWCYPEGGAKVLITGEWRTEQGVYTCLFDGCSVPAILYQAGVLRCFCPSHDPGLVTLQVACNGFIVSNACVFEYRARDSPAGSSGCHEWLTTDNDRFKLALLDRLERLESRLNASQTNNSENQSQGNQCMTFEDRLIAACEIFHRSNCPIRNLTKIEKPFRGMTLLHLSAALGYNRLVCTLLKFWRESQSALVRDELNPLRKDEFACTPLTWACALGWTDAALMLLETEPKALLEPDARGRMPLQLARDRGFLDVVDIIEDSVTSFPNRHIFLGVGHDSDVTSSPMASSCESSPQPSALAPQSRILLAPPVDTTMEERAGSPMFVDEDEMEPQFSKKPGNTLAKTLVHIHSMISEAEQEAELGHRIPGHLSPLHENTELVTGSWSSAMRLRTFSSASSQSSPLTPCSSKSSLSPGSPGFLNSPHSSPVGPDTTEFQEFIYSSRKLLERDLSDLTLTDREQWELYEAAKIIQSAYRNYKTRRHQQEQEIEAAILIQHHYRRYKEYIAFKKMTRAALIIQNQYRTHREHERFKKSRRAAAIIQNTFRSYRERRRSTQRRREQRLSKRQEARYIQKASNSDGLDRIVKQAHSPSKPQNKKYGKDRRTTPNT